MTKAHILKTLRELDPILKERYKIKKIGLFGSFASNLEKENSDIDIYVEFENKTFDNVAGLWNFLESILKRKVDLIYPHKYSNQTIIQNIQSKVIYG